MLVRALERLEAGDDEGCLQHLLAGWRREPLPEIADLIDLVSARITKVRGPIPSPKPDTVKARTKLWMDIQARRDPADVERLLMVPLPARWRDALPILDAMLDWPADPRVAMALARIAEAVPYTSASSSSFYESIFYGLASLDDIRTAAVLQSPAFVERNPDRGGLELEDEIAWLIATRPVHPPSDPETLEKLRGKFKSALAEQQTSQRSEQDFIDAIYEDPRDDAVRQVYADFLTERGDPRGELITLQLMRAQSGTSSEAMLRRERQLLAKHEKAWIGELAPWIDLDESEERWFERGFLARATLGEPARDDLAGVFSRRAWSTLRVLDVARITADEINEILTSPTGRHLAGLAGVDEVEATWLAAGVHTPEAARSLEELHIVVADLPFHSAPYRETIAQARGLPALRRLGLSLPWYGEDQEWITSGSLWQRIEFLTLQTSYHHRWVARARTSKALETLEFVMGVRRSGRWRATIVDDERRGRLRSVRLEWENGQGRPWNQMPAVATFLRDLTGSGMTRVVIAPSRALRPSLDERREIEEIIDGYGTVEHLELPWSRDEAPEVNADEEPIRLDLAGESLMPHLRELLDDLARRQLVPKIDTFCVNGGVARPVGKDPMLRLEGWATKPSTRNLAIYRDATRKTAEVSFDRKEDEPDLIVSHPKVDPTRWVIAPTVRSFITCGAPPANGPDRGAFVDRYLAWLVAFLDRYPTTFGSCAYREGQPAHVFLQELEHAPRSLGWITIFGAHNELLIPRAEMATIPDALAEQGIEGVSVLLTKRNVVLVCGSSPEDNDARRLQAVEDEMSKIYQRAFKREYGYDGFEAVGQALDPTAISLGFHRVKQKPSHSTGYLRRRGDLFEVITVSISNSNRYPFIHVWYSADLRPRSGIPPALPFYRSWYLPYAGEECGMWPATTEAFESTMDEIAKLFRLQIDPWFRSHIPPLGYDTE